MHLDSAGKKITNTCCWHIARPRFSRPITATPVYIAAARFAMTLPIQAKVNDSASQTASVMLGGSRFRLRLHQTVTTQTNLGGLGTRTTEGISAQPARK
jgi:hypothetical protein